MGKNRYLRWLLSACTIVLTCANTSAADIRIGVVNPLKVLEGAPQAEAARKRLEQEFASRDQRLAGAQKVLKQKEDRLAKDGAVMSDSERQRIEREIISERRQLRRDQTDFREDLNLRRNEEFGKIQRQVVEAIQAMAREQKYDIVVGEGVIYADPRLDVTDEIVKRLKSSR